MPKAKKSALPPATDRVFVVHGHDEGMKEAVARTLSNLKLDPVILHEHPNKGRTIIEKFEDYSDVGFAVVLLSGDDKAYDARVEHKKAKPLLRARQNVILELGFFIGKLGRAKVVALCKPANELEQPSDIDGILYVPFDSHGGWKGKLVQELNAAGYAVDANDLYTDALANRTRRPESETERLRRKALDSQTDGRKQHESGPIIWIGKIEIDEHFRFFEFRLENTGEGEVIAEAYAIDLRDETGKRIPRIDSQIRLHQRGFMAADKVQLSGSKRSYVALLQVNNGDKANTAHMLLPTPSPTSGTYGAVPLLHPGPLPLNKQQKLLLSIRIDFLDDKGNTLRDTTRSFWITPDESSSMRYRVRKSKHAWGR